MLRWSVVGRAVKAIGALVLWVFGVFLGLTFFLHGINGYPPCEGVEPGGSCAFTSVRGTTRVPYEDLGDVDVVSLVFGALILLGMAAWAWVAVDELITRRRRTQPGAHP